MADCSTISFINYKSDLSKYINPPIDDNNGSKINNLNTFTKLYLISLKLITKPKYENISTLKDLNNIYIKAIPAITRPLIIDFLKNNTIVHESINKNIVTYKIYANIQLNLNSETFINLALSSTIKTYLKLDSNILAHTTYNM